MLLEKKLGREIAAAKEVERLTSPHVDPAELPQQPKWEYGGDEESLIAAQEQEDAATGSYWVAEIAAREACGWTPSAIAGRARRPTSRSRTRDGGAPSQRWRA